MMIALFEPDIPQNTGSIVRLCACMHVPIHVIEPCGFPLDDKRLKRVAMDYTGHAELVRHASWARFLEFVGGDPKRRIILLSAHADRPYTEHRFLPDDILLLGRESAGVPENVRTRADARLTIPMQPGTRSLNVAQAASMVLGEALRQTRWI